VSPVADGQPARDRKRRQQGGIQFGFNNLTTGINSPSAIIHTFAGLPASSFYNGSSGETIDERYSVSGVPQQMRRYGTTFWSNARIYQNGSTAYTAIRSTTHTGVTMMQAGVNLSSPDGTGYPADAFRDDWHGCETAGF
jgi:hypothetical protein